MFRPPSDLSNFDSFADWVELCVLLSDSGGAMSRADMADVLRDEGLIGSSAEDMFVGDITFFTEGSFSEEDSGDYFSENVWQILTDRGRALGEAYPFLVEKDRVRLVDDSWRKRPSYAALLLADLWKTYGLESIASESFPRLFEKLVEASQLGLTRGSVVRFGVPSDDGWPSGIKERIRYLGNLLALDVENLNGKTSPKDGDRGLDVVGRLSFGDDGPGTIVLLTQCATGLHWKKKTGEPSLRSWQDILWWDAQIVRAIAIPWRLSDKERISEFRRFDAVVLDRFRLICGNPDHYMKQDVAEEILDWCEARLEGLPSLS